eukprot:gene8598-34040_t
MAAEAMHTNSGIQRFKDLTVAELHGCGKGDLEAMCLQTNSGIQRFKDSTVADLLSCGKSDVSSMRHLILADILKLAGLLPFGDSITKSNVLLYLGVIATMSTTVSVTPPPEPQPESSLLALPPATSSANSLVDSELSHPFPCTKHVEASNLLLNLRTPALLEAAPSPSGQGRAQGDASGSGRGRRNGGGESDARDERRRKRVRWKDEQQMPAPLESAVHVLPSKEARGPPHGVCGTCANNGLDEELGVASEELYLLEGEDDARVILGLMTREELLQERSQEAEGG